MTFLGYQPEFMPDYETRAQRGYNPTDENCIATIPTNSFPFVATYPGSTLIAGESELSKTYLSSLMTECVNDIIIHDTTSAQLPVITINTECMKIIHTSDVFGYGCILPKGCGKPRYQDLSTTWMFLKTVLCYGDTTVLIQTTNVILENFYFKNNEKCDYQNITDFYYLATTFNPSPSYRMISSRCVDELRRSNFSLPETVKFNQINDQIQISTETLFVSQKICADWLSFPTKSEALNRIPLWHKLNGSFICKALTYSDEYTGTCDWNDPSIVKFLASKSISSRYYAYYSSHSAGLSGYKYCTNNIVADAALTHLHSFKLDDLKYSFIEMVRDMFLFLIEEAITIIFKVIFTLTYSLWTTLYDQYNNNPVFSELLNKFGVIQLLILFPVYYLCFRDLIIAGLLTLAAFAIYMLPWSNLYA